MKYFKDIYEYPYSLVTGQTIVIVYPKLTYSVQENEEYQEKHINRLLKIMKDRGYYGLTMIFTYMNISNQRLYVWGSNLGPPAPVSNLNKAEGVLSYSLTIILRHHFAFIIKLPLKVHLSKLFGF